MQRERCWAINRPLRVEIGDVCAEINTENDYAVSCLDSGLKSFYSKRHPDFVLNVRKKTPTVELSQDVFVDSEKGDLEKRVRIEKQDDKFIVLVEIISSKSTTIFEAGFIDLERNICQFNDEAQFLTQLLLNAFFRCCLQFFLEKTDAFLIHSCGVVRDDSAYIFAGSPGSGKSTVGQLSRGLTVLSDDFVCIKDYGGYYRAYGTPWHGDDKNQSAEVKKVFFLRQDSMTRFKKLSPGEAASEVLSNIYHKTLDKEIIKNILGIVTELTLNVPCYLMHFSLKDSLWDSIDSLEAGDML